MDLEIFLEQLQRIERQAEKNGIDLEEDARAGIQGMPGLVKTLEETLPAWLYFIDQTKIGNQGMLEDILADMNEAVERQDQVLLLDVLLFGLRALAAEYEGIIKEALYEEPGI